MMSSRTVAESWSVIQNTAETFPFDLYREIHLKMGRPPAILGQPWLNRLGHTLCVCTALKRKDEVISLSVNTSHHRFIIFLFICPNELFTFVFFHFSPEMEDPAREFPSCGVRCFTVMCLYFYSFLSRTSHPLLSHNPSRPLADFCSALNPCLSSGDCFHPYPFTSSPTSPVGFVLNSGRDRKQELWGTDVPSKYLIF